MPMPDQDKDGPPPTTSGPINAPAASAREPVLTDSDRHLLDLLKEDARRSISTLAAMTGTSRPSVKRRMDRLQARGIIRRYTVETALPKQGQAAGAARGVDALFTLVGRSGHYGPLLAALRQRPECLAAWAVTGSPDVFVLVHCLSVTALDATRAHMLRHPAVKSVSTAIILDGWRREDGG